MPSLGVGGSGGGPVGNGSKGDRLGYEPYRKARRMLAAVARRRCTMVDLERSKTRLEEELARVDKRIVDLKLEPVAEELESGGDNTPLSEAADSARIAEEKELQETILGGLLDRAAALEQALRRVADGTYGLCVTCKAKIPESRLGVLPEVSLCAPCQAKQEEAAAQKKMMRTDKRSTF